VDADSNVPDILFPARLERVGESVDLQAKWCRSWRGGVLAFCFGRKWIESSGGMSMFIESEIGQASRIAHASGKAVVCVGTMELFAEGIKGRLDRKIHRMSQTGNARLGRILRRLNPSR